MKNLESNYYNPVFSHIYVEKEVKENARTQRILNQFPHAVRIEIDHYKDVFCRSNQNYCLQHKSQSLIIAAKHGELIYKGAPVCQSFGNEYFYYTSCMMNCIYDCEYCYLKGMYPSGSMVIFVNIEEIFAQVEKILEEHPVYLCVSYDTDMMAMEHVTGYVKEWVEFSKKHENLKIEIRTKCAGQKIFEEICPQENVIFAFTLSPQEIITRYEHGTPPLSGRIGCAMQALLKGFSVRLCFDPVIYCTDWKKQYEEMINEVWSHMNPQKIVDVSVGSFRVSQDYLKNMRKSEPYSCVVQFPFQNDGGVYHYPDSLMEEMELFVTEKLKETIPEEKIFRWENKEG
ncbi:MAG: hypothetical protein PUF12_01800 [Thermoflexaceae bacterium]|nr:hypothetical protein [Thermoflexaceae bacterium]